MKKTTIGFFFFTLIIGAQLYGQTLSETELIGTWKVSKINKLLDEVPEGQEQQLEFLKTVFLKAEFEFKEDKNFSFNIGMEEIEMQDVHWKIASENSVVIQEWKDKDSDGNLLMVIDIKKEMDKMIFQLAETPITLEMERELK
ncbi:MAG: hypothetical protein R2788_15630 [Saprospiraceae bacterium]